MLQTCCKLAAKDSFVCLHKITRVWCCNKNCFQLRKWYSFINNCSTERSAPHQFCSKLASNFHQTFIKLASKQHQAASTSTLHQHQHQLFIKFASKSETTISIRNFYQFMFYLKKWKNLAPCADINCKYNTCKWINYWNQTHALGMILWIATLVIK